MEDIFEGTPQHEDDLESAREEVLPQGHKSVRAKIHDDVREWERQARLVALSKVLLVIVRSRFPKLNRLAKAMAWQIKDVVTMNEVVGKVGAAQTTDEAMDSLLSWLPGDDSEV